LKSIFFLLEKRRLIKKDFGGKKKNERERDQAFNHFLLDLKKFYDGSAGFFLVGWFLHYFPFYLMGRQLFLHHYMPALYCSILLFSVGFDLMTIRVKHRLVVALLVILSVIYVYQYFIPITYAEPWTKDACIKAKWRSTWDFDCNQ
jgi:dolichyl-phosphate-mannose-protein mannosyltransferase